MDAVPRATSLLEELMKLVVGTGPLSINFEDLTGVSYEVPDLRLSFDLHIHTCAFCMFAKSNHESHNDCIGNKMAANRLASRRRTGFVGQCHLGLTDIVEPLVSRGQVLGVFYFGSVLVSGTEKKARERIVRYCTRRQFDPKPYLDQLEAAPRVEESAVAAHQEHLRLVAEVAARLVSAYSPSTSHFRTRVGAQSINAHRLTPLVRRAVHFIHHHLSRPLKVHEVARHCNCHPDHLNRAFRQQLECTVSGYIARQRVERARQLLELDRYNLDEIAYLSGFHDQSHLARAFRKFFGVTPGDLRSRRASSEAEAVLSSEPTPFSPETAS